MRVMESLLQDMRKAELEFGQTFRKLYGQIEILITWHHLISGRRALPAGTGYFTGWRSVCACWSYLIWQKGVTMMRFCDFDGGSKYLNFV